MKICPNCSNIVEDNAAFCDKCGAYLAVQNSNPANYAQQPANQQNFAQQPQYNYGVNPQQYQNAAPQIPPKKKNTGMIIGIVAAVLLVLAGIGFVAQKAFRNQGYGGGENDYSTPSYNFGTDDSSFNDTSSYNFDTDDSSSDDSTASATDHDAPDAKAYNKGSVVDGWYVNEWANIKFEISSNWTDGSEAEYAAFEGDPNTECGIILDDFTSGKQLVICFEKLTGLNTLIAEDDYLDVVTSGIKQQYTDANLSCTIADCYDTTVANEKFRTTKVIFDGSTAVQEIRVRKYDGYIIFIAVVAQDSFDASATANNICAVD